MSDPAQAEQVVVSMLAILGIGLYAPDGSRIRAGTETSDGDFYLFEPAARGLVNMLRERDDPDEQVSFRDFHASLAGAGYGGTAEELAATYAASYTARPDAPVSVLVRALGPVDVEATLPSFEAWLLLVDGFVRKSVAAAAMSLARPGLLVVAAAERGRGVAPDSVRTALAVPIQQWAAVVAQLSAMLAAWRITVTASPAAVHEGHGGLGSPTRITAQMTGPTAPLISPFGGTTIVPAASGTAGLLVAWLPSPTAGEHGTLADLATVADQGGNAATSYTPRQEPAGGQGIDREETGRIHAGFQRKELVRLLYGPWADPYAGHMSSFIRSDGHLDIGWHEKAEAVIKIVWTDTYSGVADTITFLGNLTGTEPDPVSGGVAYIGTGTATGSRAGWKGCNPGIDVVPSGTVPATFRGYTTATGSIMISAWADVFTTLAGISTAPMEVPIVGGFAQFDLPTVGDLCPRSSHGEMTVTALVLPN